MKVAIFPGSFKPPHLGHLQMIEKMLLSKSPFEKIYILISKKPRPLQPSLYDISSLPKDDIFLLLKPFQKRLSSKLTKEEYLEEYKKLIQNKKIPAVTAEESEMIWKIYIEYLKKKYTKEMMKTEIKPMISWAPSPIIATYNLVTQLLKKTKPSNIYLVKSKKNSSNARFDYLLKKTPDLHVKVLSSKSPNLHSRLLRKAILDKNKEEILQYIPDDLSPLNKKNILDIFIKNAKNHEKI